MNPQEILHKEGFHHVYEWHDGPNTEYPKHAHIGRVTLFVVKGDVTFTFSDSTTKTISSGQRFDVPVGQEHTAKVGQNGCVIILSGRWLKVILRRW
jgi:mannose-6-phosphate isomerase-like protein (cupin superfamily)